MKTDDPIVYPNQWQHDYYVLSELRLKLEYVIATYIASSRRRPVMVDVGCGSMPYKRLFAPHVERYIGVDIAENEAADIHLTALGIPIDDAYADLLLSTQVLEHVDSPEMYLRECYRILKKGGLLVLSTHGYWVYHPCPTDYWRWTSDGLSTTIARAGFNKVESIGIMGAAAAALQLFQDAVKHKINRLFKPAVFYCGQNLIRFVDRMYSRASRDIDACVYVVVARK
jgi:SAM-dependent methyltransferase